MHLHPSTSADKLASTKLTCQCTFCSYHSARTTCRKYSTTVSCLLLQVVSNSETELNTSVNFVTDQPTDRLEVHLKGLTVMG